MIAMSNLSFCHVPVLLDECMSALAVREGGVYADCIELCAAGDDMALVYGINTESPLGVTETLLREVFGYLD